MKLICVFVFAYSKSQFSHEAQISFSQQILYSKGVRSGLLGKGQTNLYFVLGLDCIFMMISSDKSVNSLILFYHREKEDATDCIKTLHFYSS